MDEQSPIGIPVQASESAEKAVPGDVRQEVLETLGLMNEEDGTVDMTSNNGDGGNEVVGAAVSVARGVEGEVTGKRKRGRPRKQMETFERMETVASPQPSGGTQKRGRGRPKGSGKWQALAMAFGGRNVGVIGSNFTPYVLIIGEGEDIAERMKSISGSQKAWESFCILSAVGSVSLADILQPGSPPRTTTFKGHFDIISLAGTHMHTERGDDGQRVTRLSIQLSDPDGHLFGGPVHGQLIAAVPTQLILATFRQNTKDLPKIRQFPATPIGEAAVEVTGTTTAAPLRSIEAATDQPPPVPLLSAQPGDQETENAACNEEEDENFSSWPGFCGNSL